MKNILLITISYLLLTVSLTASQFEELDKPPEGAHEGQMMLGGFVSLGYPYGDLISAEKNFTKGDSYQFENGVIKEFLVTHLSYDFGLSFEYMPMDNVGVKTKLKRVIVVQRTLFGSNYQNWSKTLYSNYSLLLGPSFHLTTRKLWDVTLTPVIGYTYAKYHAAPIEAELNSSNITGSRNRNVNGITYGAELNCTLYFSGGLYISLGADWNRYPLKFSPAINLSNSSNSNTLDKSSGNLDTINFALSAGYTFSY